MFTLETLVGFAAAVCTTVSYIPQVKKCWQTGSTGDLSLKMLLILATGIGLWVAYGFLKGDTVIVVANSVSLLLLGNLVVFKVRETAGGRRHDRPDRCLQSSSRPTKMIRGKLGGFQDET